MDLTLRLATADDGAVVAELVNDLYSHYYGADIHDSKEVECYVHDTVMTAGTACEILLAERAGKALGLATFSVNHFGPYLRGQLTLKDLYVRAEGRGQGIGPQILQGLARLALDRNCDRLDWTSETTNPRALAFYDALGARRETEKVYYRLDGEALNAMAAKEL